MFGHFADDLQKYAGTGNDAPLGLAVRKVELHTNCRPGTAWDLESASYA